MHSFCLKCCACVIRGVAALGLILFALSSVDSSVSHATSLSHGSYSIDIEVIDTAGPIWVEDQFTGTASNGLPTIEIHEKFSQPGDDSRFWADVELKVTVRTHDGGDNPIKSIFDEIDDIFDKVFNIFNWGSQGDDWSTSGETPDDWQDNVVIGIDKFVKNRTGVEWRDFRIELGTGIGGEFVPSDASDNLYIVSDPMAKEVTSFYNDPPGQDNPISDFLQWTTNGVDRFGQTDGDRAGFWFGVHVPYELFEPDPHDSDYWRARFTLRQHTGVPEPATGVLLLAGSMICLLCRKRKLS